MNMKRILIYIILLFTLTQLFAQAIIVPISSQIPLIVKILSFERNLMESASDEINIGIIFQSKTRESLLAKAEILKSISSQKSSAINNKKIVVKEIDISDTDINTAVNKVKTDVLIITPIRLVNLNELSDLCKKKKILSFSLSPDYLKYKFSVSLDILGERPQILINLNSAKAEGANFSSQLLKLSKIID